MPDESSSTLSDAERTAMLQPAFGPDVSTLIGHARNHVDRIRPRGASLESLLVVLIALKRALDELHNEGHWETVQRMADVARGKASK